MQARLLCLEAEAYAHARLNVQYQPVRLPVPCCIGREGLMWYRLELDGDHRDGFIHALARAQVEGHSLPPPVVDI